MNDATTNPPQPSALATLAEISVELADLVPALRRLVEAETLRNLACGHSFEISASAVRSLISARRLRDEYFSPSMNDGAWSVLLELFVNRIEGTSLNIARLGMAIGLSSDNALHWIDWLAGQGLILHRHVDGDASPVDLTDAGADQIRAYLLASLSLSPWVQ